MSGLPIGAIMSKVTCNTILGVAEHTWAKRDCYTMLPRLRALGAEWCDVVSCARFVDDLIMQS
eukprot:7964165-Lingulodinium_polyedra.AAC.1